MPTPVPRLARALDLIGLVVFIAGAACYGYAYLGLEEIRSGQLVRPPGLFSALQAAEGYYWYSQVGIALSVAGIGVFLAAFTVARRRRAPRPAEG